MEIITRAFPVQDRQAIVDFGKDIDDWPREDKAEFVAQFGTGGKERWYFQEIEGKPYVIAVAEVVNSGRGYDFLASSDDPFTSWFRSRVQEITNFDLSKAPRGPASEFIYELNDE